MNRIKFLAAALLLGASVLANAATSVLDVNGSLNGFIAGKSYSFDVSQSGTYDAIFNVANSNLALVLFGVFEKNGSSWTPVGGTLGSGSFFFTANDALQYKAVVGDVNLAGNRLAYNIDITTTGGGVTPVPEPEAWAIMLLGVALVVYQTRPRKTSGSLSALGYS